MRFLSLDDYGFTLERFVSCSRFEVFNIITDDRFPVIFVLFQIPTALATNFGMLLAFRFLTGFFGSPALATGGATIADMYRPQKQAYGLAIWGIGAV